MFRLLDFVKVKGKNIPVKVYELIDHKDNISNSNIELIKTFEKGLDLYYQQKWDQSISMFTKAESLEEKFESRNTTPSLVYINRCKAFQDNPPSSDWDGVWTMTSK